MPLQQDMYYILEGHTPVPVDRSRWSRWFEEADRQVSLTDVGDIQVSTVFLGMNHQFGLGPPLLFESMAFALRDGDRVSLGDFQERYATWDEAEAGHAAMCAQVQALLMNRL